MSKEALKEAGQQDCTDLHADWIFWRVSNTIRLLSSVVLMELCLGADTGFTAAATDSYQHFTRRRLSAAYLSAYGVKERLNSSVERPRYRRSARRTFDTFLSGSDPCSEKFYCIHLLSINQAQTNFGSFFAQAW